MESKQNLHPSQMGQTFGRLSHPLISELYHKSTGAVRGTVGGSRTPLLDSLEIDLNDLSGEPYPHDLRKRLRDSHDMEKAAYELRIAAGFRRLGHAVYWLPAAANPHAEFLVFAPTFDVLSVECKKRDAADGYEQRGEAFWRHFQYHLRQQMEAASLNYWVKLSGREFLVADVQPLVSEIIDAIRLGERGQFDSMSLHYRVEYLKLADHGDSIPAELVQLFPEGDRGVNTGRRNRDQTTAGALENPKLIRMEIVDDPEHRIVGIIRNLKVAANQVVKGIPNLVFLDVNLPKHEDEVSEFDAMVDSVTEELKAHHNEVSAVILTNMYPALSLDRHLGFRIRTELVVHPKPAVCLPRELRFPGDVAGTRWLPGVWGVGS